MAKALTANDGAAKPVWFGCVAESCHEPQHREKNRRRMQSWAQATAAAARVPQGITLGDAMGSVFTQLAKLDAAETGKDLETSSPEGSVGCNPFAGSPRSTDMRPSSSSQSPSLPSLVQSERFPKLPLGSNPPKPKSRSSATMVKKASCSHGKLFARKGVPSVTNEAEKFKGLVQDTVCNFYGLNEQDEELNVLPGEEPEFYEVETTLDTGASTHAADRVDFPGYTVEESPGSRAGQLFGCAGGKSLQNEGQITVNMISPIEGTAIQLCTQVTKVTRPLLSVTKLTEEGKLRVLCDQEKAVVMDLQNKVLATFPKKNGLYVCTMKVRNPKYKNKEPFPRPLP